MRDVIPLSIVFPTVLFWCIFHALRVCLMSRYLAFVFPIWFITFQPLFLVIIGQLCNVPHLAIPLEEYISPWFIFAYAPSVLEVFIPPRPTPAAFKATM